MRQRVSAIRAVSVLKYPLKDVKYEANNFPNSFTRSIGLPLNIQSFISTICFMEGIHLPHGKTPLKNRQLENT